MEFLSLKLTFFVYFPKFIFKCSCITAQYILTISIRHIFSIIYRLNSVTEASLPKSLKVQYTIFYLCCIWSAFLLFFLLPFFSCILSLDYILG